MATVLADGIETHFEVFGAGPPLLMYAPGGFDAALEKWSTQSIYATIKLLDALPERYTCIAFDRREAGSSGGRVERITWRHYAAQGKALLDHLGFERAHVMGGCMGVSAALAFGVEYPAATASLVLFWPAGGPKYRLSAQLRFTEHLGFVHRNGLDAVVEVARTGRKSFARDPRGGPWSTVIARDPQFAQAFAQQDAERYKLAVEATARTLIDRDTVAGAEPEDLMRCDVPALIVPGRDASHATSAARYLEECLPHVQYWDVAVAEQTMAATRARLIDFLDSIPFGEH